MEEAWTGGTRQGLQEAEQPDGKFCALPPCKKPQEAIAAAICVLLWLGTALAVPTCPPPACFYCRGPISGGYLHASSTGLSEAGPLSLPHESAAHCLEARAAATPPACCPCPPLAGPDNGSSDYHCHSAQSSPGRASDPPRCVLDLAEPSRPLEGNTGGGRGPQAE